MKIARYFDSAILKPQFTQDEVKDAIALSIKHDCRTVCVRPADIELAVSMCKGTNTGVSCVLAFPHGDASSQAKTAAAADYAKKGVMEIDMVMNFGLARSGEWDRVREDIKGVVDAAHRENVGVKVIFETCYLTVDEIKRGVGVCIEAGADFVKTSTGFGTGGATEEAVTAMVEAANGRIKVKPSGGMRTYEACRRFVDMGADRLGVGAGSVPEICRQEEESNVQG